MFHLAHRGLTTNAPENSVRAFKAALVSGFDGVELDIRTLKSGQVIVFHDETLLRLTGDQRSVYDLDFDELRQLKLPDGSSIPTLEEAFAVLGQSLINIELKDQQSAQPLARLLRKQKNIKVIVSSKQRAALRAFRVQDKTTPLGFISNHHFMAASYAGQGTKTNPFHDPSTSPELDWPVGSTGDASEGCSLSCEKTVYGHVHEVECP